MTTATTQPDIAPTLAHALKHKHHADILFVLSNVNECSSTYLEVSTGRQSNQILFGVRLLAALGLVESTRNGNLNVHRLIPENREFIREALDAHQAASGFRFVLRDPPKPKSRRGLTLAGTCS